MSKPKLPYDLRVKTMELMDQGFSKEVILNEIHAEAAPYVCSEDELMRCIRSIKGKHTQRLRPRKRLAIWFVLVFLFEFWFAGISLGFNFETRKYILTDAIRFCPQDLKLYLKTHQKIITEGMLFAKEDYCSEKNPVSYIKDSFETLRQRMMSGKSNEYNTINQFGVLASFISEIIYCGDIDIFLKHTPEIVRYDGFHEVTDVNERADKLFKKYISYWEDNKKEVKDYLYNVAVNEIADFWVSVWKASGYNIKGLCSVGLEISRVSPIKSRKEKPPHYENVGILSPGKIVDFIDNTRNYAGKIITLIMYVGSYLVEVGESLQDLRGRYAEFYTFGENGAHLDIQISIPKHLSLPNAKFNDLVVVTFICREGDLIRGNEATKIVRP